MPGTVLFEGFKNRRYLGQGLMPCTTKSANQKVCPTVQILSATRTKWLARAFRNPTHDIIIRAWGEQAQQAFALQNRIDLAIFLNIVVAQFIGQCWLSLRKPDKSGDYSNTASPAWG